MTEDKALLTLLRAKSTYQTSGGTMAEWINPDGPLAADRIEVLTAEVERLRGALKDLLEDTQHENHNCIEEDCPVKAARAALEGKQ